MSSEGRKRESRKAGKPDGLTLRIYRDSKREFRWTLIAANGRKLANGGESYKYRADLAKAIDLVMGKFMEWRTDVAVQDLANAKLFRPEEKLKEEGQ